MTALNRFSLPSLLALVTLVLLSRSLAAHSPSPDPLAFAAEVGLNQAWYVQHGYADATAILPPVAPACFPTSPSQPRTIITPTLDNHIHLPLVQSNRMVEARALWVTRWDYRTITDVQTLVENAAAAGFNILLFQVRGTADALYTPGLEPWAAWLSGDPGRAEEELTRALEMNPHSPAAWYHWGVVLAAQGRVMAAREAYMRVVVLDPGGYYGSRAAKALREMQARSEH